MSPANRSSAGSDPDVDRLGTLGAVDVAGTVVSSRTDGLSCGSSLEVLCCGGTGVGAVGTLNSSILRADCLRRGACVDVDGGCEVEDVSPSGCRADC